MTKENKEVDFEPLSFLISDDLREPRFGPLGLQITMRLSENEKFFARSRKVKILTRRIH